MKAVQRELRRKIKERKDRRKVQDQLQRSSIGGVGEENIQQI